MTFLRCLLALVVSANSVPAGGGAGHAADGPTVITVRYSPADRATGRYQYVPFEVPAGTTGIRIEQQYDRAGGENAVDLGLFEPGALDLGSRALRGWSGGARSEVVLTASTASPGYRPGPLPEGRWHVILGLYKVAPAGVEVTLRITVSSAATADAPRRWYAGDLHLHTEHSDGSERPEAVLDLARDAGLDFVAITDHNNTTHALAVPPDASRKPLHIVGEEITTPGGHANVWGLKPGDWLDFRLSAHDPRIHELAAAAEARGALFSINHPVADCDACDWRHPIPTRTAAIEVWNGPRGPQAGAVALWDELLRNGHRVTGVASSDWHRTPAVVGVGSVRVLADALTEPAILGAIRRGAVVMMRDPASPPPTLLVSAGGRAAGVGETLDAAPGAELAVDVTVPAISTPGLPSCPASCTIELFWDGEKVDSASAAAGRVSFRRPVAPGYLRIALVSGGTTVALTNPVFVSVR